MDYLPILIARELRRIGADDNRLTGLAGAVTGPEFLNWLQSLPTALGYNEFIRRCELSASNGGPTSAIGCSLPSFAADYEDVESEELLALMHELDRVVPPSMRGDVFGFDTPHGHAAAIAALRALPDAAGPAAAKAAASDMHRAPDE